LRQTEQKVTKWAGGTTTELFIFPENSTYSDRNFLFRLSSATVEAEKSDFTRLPGFSRLLMILDGKIEIHHKGKYSKVLKKFDIDEFQGSWETSSQGQAIDFNLMMAEGIQGSLKASWFILQGSVNLDFAIKNTYTGVYVFKGTAEMLIADESFILESGDFLIMEGFV
jgi:environmental stress-induced protein Ves